MAVLVMLVPAIHVFISFEHRKTSMAGTRLSASPAMTTLLGLGTGMTCVFFPPFLAID
jgi:hypothetical protein